MTKQENGLELHHQKVQEQISVHEWIYFFLFFFRRLLYSFNALGFKYVDGKDRSTRVYDIIVLHVVWLQSVKMNFFFIIIFLQIHESWSYACSFNEPSTPNPLSMVTKGITWSIDLSSYSEFQNRALRLLDVGAGSGGPTAKLAPLFNEVITTEAASYMVMQLRERGFTYVKGEEGFFYIYFIIICFS